MLLTDFYKVHHNRQYPEGMTLLYSNFTPRKSRMKGVDSVVFFGLQHFIKEYLINKFNEDFFEPSNKAFGRGPKVNETAKKERITEYSRHIGVDTKHIEALWDLGYLPLEIRALPEGTQVPIGIPCFTIHNTHPDFAWLTNYVETLMSCMLWQPTTSATIAYEYKKLLTKYALETTGSAEFVQWQGHDFSFRGMSSVESAILSGMGHLLSFTGTDTIPAIYQLEQSYSATGLIGASVPATEHSVMCMGEKATEIKTFERLMELYPTGILSVVSDTWNLWDVITKYLPQLKEKILARDGKLVIRPDSGDPVKILTGWTPYERYMSTHNKERKEIPDYEQKGLIELLWELFGGKINKNGYKELDPHIGAIYGDSITLDRANQICERLKSKGFASTNVVLGIGSYTYQYNTRDTFGFAIKATYGEVEEDFLATAESIERGTRTVGREIFKDPVTDDGTKKSAKGLLRVDYTDTDSKQKLQLIQQCDWKSANEGALEVVFKDSKLVKETTLDEIRDRLKI